MQYEDSALLYVFPFIPLISRSYIFKVLPQCFKSLRSGVVIFSFMRECSMEIFPHIEVLTFSLCHLVVQCDSSTLGSVASFVEVKYVIKH